MDVLFEDFRGDPADLLAAERWTADFGTTSPVFPDADYLVYDLYNRNDYQPQYILIGRDRVVKQYWSRWDEASITAAIEAALAE